MSSASTPDLPEKAPDESSKLKTFLSILRKFVGVSDIASVRFSLPAQLLEPTPNLEYWNYLDRPETFARSAISPVINLPDSVSDWKSTASAHQKNHWDGCWRFCDSGLPKTWFAILPGFEGKCSFLLTVNRNTLRVNLANRIIQPLGNFLG
jgi:hypothetical protein